MILREKKLTFARLLSATVIIAGGCGSYGGSKAVAPSISAQPASASVAAGQMATFSVVATGTSPLNYQWQKNGANISGANSANYATPPAQSNDNGSTFDVAISNSAGTVTSSTATLTVTADAPAITTQPASITVTVGATAAFSVTATGASPLKYQWQKGAADISGANSASYTTPATQASDSGSTFDVEVSNSSGTVTSNMATLTVEPGSVNVLTYHNDVARTGQNLNETILTPSNVHSTTFGKLGFLSVQGLVDAEPLYASNLTIGGAKHNVVFVVTEHDMAYAFDADTFAQLWTVSLLGSNETTSDARNCGQVTPEIGITSTPVIDPTAGPHGTMWVVAMSKDNSSNYFQRLHALDITTGADIEPPQTIQATFPNASGHTTFDPKQYKERAALLLLNGNVYLSWSSHCDVQPYTGWVMGYNQSTLQQVSVFDFTPNGSDGSVWMAGDGPAADGAGNIYFLAANGTFDTALNSNGFPVNGDFGNAFLKLSTNGNKLAVADYFSMNNTANESAFDVDLGSGGELLLPDMADTSGVVRHLAVGAGKDSNIYLVNRDSMGKFNPNNDSAIYQELDGALPGGAWSMPAYFNSTLYYGSVGQPLKAFGFTNAKLGTSSTSQSAASFAYPGVTPSISANGTSNGIVWAVENGSTAVLHAYDARDLSNELYNSNQAGSRDQFGGNKFITPMIANGKVYVGTPTGVIVFGPLP